MQDLEGHDVVVCAKPDCKRIGKRFKGDTYIHWTDRKAE